MSTREENNSRKIQWFLEGIGLPFTGFYFGIEETEEESESQQNLFDVDGSDSLERTNRSIGRAFWNVGEHLRHSMTRVSRERRTVE